MSSAVWAVLPAMRHSFDPGCLSLLTIGSWMIGGGAAENRPKPVEQESIERNGPVGNSEDEALARLLIGEIRQVLDALSDGQREVLLLRIVGGLTLEETAAAVGRKISSVKALQRRGIASIRRTGVVTIRNAASAGELAIDLT